MNYAHSKFCNFCGKANAPAKIREVVIGNEIIKEAVYTCPNCGSLVARDSISRTKIEK